MSPQSETTAMQRLGHVFGWMGFAFGGLLILAGIVAIGINAWSYLIPGDVSSGYNMELPDGRKYIAIGEGSPEDAERAVREYAGEQIAVRPYFDWKVFPESSGRGAMTAELELEREKVRAIKRARIRMNSVSYMATAALFAVVPGILIVLFGLALRYIFAGPKMRVL